MYDFGRADENWFTHAQNLVTLLGEYVGRPGVRFLELGSWKGRSAVWCLENVLTHRTAAITCVDLWDVNAWDETDEKEKLFGNQKRLEELQTDRLYETFLGNVNPFGSKVTIRRGRTDEALQSFARDGELFDFIYVDADHSKEAVLKDVQLSCLCLRQDGLVLLDDAGWPSVQDAIKQLAAEGLKITPLGYNGAYFRFSDVPPEWIHHVATEQGLPANSAAEDPATRFCSPKYVYLASADQFEGLAQVLAEPIPSVERYYSVIGGMGGLNILSRIEAPREIVFFDINKYTIDIAKIHVALIAESQDRFDFISLYFQRSFTSRYTPQNINDYLGVPVEPAYRSRVLAALGEDLFSTYEYYYLPFINSSDSEKAVYGSRTHHCTSLRIFHYAPIGGVMTWPFASPEKLEAHKATSTNSFFFGRGWLGDDESFLRVKTTLATAKVSFVACGIDNLKLDLNCGVYASNIPYGDEPYLSDLINSARWMIWYSKESQWLRAQLVSQHETTPPAPPNSPSTDNTQRPPLILAGEGIRDTHKSCCEGMRRFFDPDQIVFLEIIEPPDESGHNYGFRFFAGQIPITVGEFLKEDEACLAEYPIIVFHILLGCGTSIQAWKACLEKALAICGYVLVVEHRQACTDWPEPDVDPDTLLPEERIEEILQTTGLLRGKCHVANKSGSLGDPRNIIWALNRESSVAYSGPDSKPRNARALFFGDFYSPVALSPDTFSTATRNVFIAHDFVSCNFEGSVGQSSSVAKRFAGSSLKIPAECLTSLRSAGVTHLSCANNHIMDGGLTGMELTLAEAKGNGLSVSGVGAGEKDAYNPYRFSAKGNRISVISVAEAEFGAYRPDLGYGFARATAERAKRSIREEKAKGRIVVIQPHAGIEEVDIPLSNWRDLYRDFIDQGADIVIAHHPHVVQGIEIYKHRFIFYSLGNFLFKLPSMAENTPWNRGLGVSLTISKQQLIGCALVFTKFSGDIVEIDPDPDRKKQFDDLSAQLQEGYAEREASLCQKLYAERYRGYYRHSVMPATTNIAEVSLMLHNLRFESHRWCVERALESLLPE